MIPKSGLFRLITKRIYNARGSTTLEATLIIPVIMLLLFSMVSLGLFLYYKFVIFNSAVYTAEQTAMTWNNSRKNLETGMVEGKGDSPTRSDGLYWRLTDDFFQAPLVVQKQDKALVFFDSLLGKPVFSEMEKTSLVSYQNQIISRQVSVDTERQVVIRDPFISKSATGTSASAKSEVVEPQEFIRNYELGSTYLKQFLNYLESGGQTGEDKSPNEPVYASKNSNVNGQKVYHFQGCRYINQIKPENLINFNSEEEAQEAGFHICLVCAKSKKAEKDEAP